MPYFRWSLSAVVLTGLFAFAAFLPSNSSRAANISPPDGDIIGAVLAGPLAEWDKVEDTEIGGAGAKTLADLPEKTSNTFLDLIQADRYTAKPVDLPSEAEGEFEADNPDQGYRTLFGQDGVSIHPRGLQTSFGMKISGWGYGEDLQPLPAASPKEDGIRVEYVRGPVTEWYVNRKSGLEQGFTLAEPPASSGSDEGAPFNVELALNGALTPSLANNILTLTGTDNETGKPVRLTYGGLKVWDATGRILPSQMQLDDARLTLSVEDTNAVYPVTIDPVVTNEQQKLTASDAGANDLFGYSVAISGYTVVVGAHADGDGGSYSGSAYVFVRSGTSWAQQAKLTASDATAYDTFGWSVAISGDTVVVGANADDDGGSGSGSAYVFVRSGTSWSQQAKLRASDAATDDQFGWSVAIAGNTAVVGTYSTSASSAYVFVRSGTTWSEQQKLAPLVGTYGDLFGSAVAISGDTVVVGAYGDDILSLDEGSAYVFVRDGTNWSQQAKLRASDAATEDQFGISVAISDDTVVVGAWADGDGGYRSGSAYVFARNVTTWSQQTKLVASDAAELDQFGWSVGISGDRLVVGALGDSDAGTNSGSAYVFERSSTSWEEKHKLLASDAEQFDTFGYSVAIFGGTTIVGAFYDDNTGGIDAGSAYVFSSLPQTFIVASVLPNARAMQTGAGPVTAFSTILNAGANTALDCSFGLPDGAPAGISSFLYQTTDISNAPTGSPNTPVDIPTSGAQGFYFAIDANAAVSENLALVFDCANADPVQILWGVNTFAFTASSLPLPDMVAIVSTLNNDGYITIPASGTAAQNIAAAAVVNIGATGAVTVQVTEQADNGPDPNMAANLLICETNSSGACISSYAPSLNITATNGETRFFQILAIGTGGAIADDPAINRAHLYFRSGADVVGATSVAVRRAAE
ncbi:hypothetical protein CSC94_18785 [Zhengella mangrovi]|uniref:Uncharacterized protein n=1 Tax=Zhengella mangrovi TaxID=1982044 RepID=A0A2G1QJK8_9HYPH|nr:FG-GAP repeat protein [Zhengella mangrovi]PHP65408.1 hypothetical protein CSC94_18785 [Zhengella mangrovi]